MKLGIPVYEGVDLLDVMGPFEMFSWVKDSSHSLTPLLLSEDGQPVTSGNGIRFHVHGSFVTNPSLGRALGSGRRARGAAKDASRPRASLLRLPSPDCCPRASGCALSARGALLLGRAGLLAGHQATTHWAFSECLARFEGVTVVPGHPRFVVSGNRLTGGGISSGLDEALELIVLLFGKATAESVQLTTQYFPGAARAGHDPCSSALQTSLVVKFEFAASTNVHSQERSVKTTKQRLATAFLGGILALTGSTLPIAAHAQVAPGTRMKLEDFVQGPDGARRVASLQKAVARMKSLDNSKNPPGLSAQLDLLG